MTVSYTHLDVYKRQELAQFLPLPTVEFDGTQYYLDYNRPHSIGKLRKFYGVPAVVLRAYAYIRSLGADGLKQVSELAILNNNYLLKKQMCIRDRFNKYYN